MGHSSVGEPIKFSLEQAFAMADAWEGLRLVILYVGWPGLVLVSLFTLWRASRFYQELRHTAPGILVLLTVIGWVLTLAGVALVSTFYLNADPENAGPVVLPVFVLWAGSLVTSVWVMQRWGTEAVKLDAYYGELEEIDRMKSGFINHVAHELNTPMTPIRIQLDLLERESYGPLVDRQKAAVERVQRNLTRLGTLVDQVLLAAFIQSGRLDLNREPVDLHDLVEDAVAGARGMVPEAPPVDVASNRAVAHADQNHLGYAVQQLVHYALRQHEGFDPVEVRLEDDGGRSARLTVRFMGGVEGDRVYRLFTDPLFLPSDSTEGLGLELFIAHGIVGLHGGRLHIRPEGPQTTFDALLPLDRTPVGMPALARDPRGAARTAQGG